MKKIINGKIYNTETAEEIEKHWEGPSSTDFSHFQESLYRKKTGEFFVAGSGGPMSKYSVTCGQNSWSGGSDIIPLDSDEAKEWLENYADSETYLKYFTAEE